EMDIAGPGSRPIRPYLASVSSDPCVKLRVHTTALNVQPQGANERSRRSFLLAGISAAAGITAFNWLRTRPDDGAVSWPLRRVLEFNERLSHTRFSNAHLAPNFPTELAETPRENGGVGLNEEIDLRSWSLEVLNAPSPKPIELTLADIKSLPRVEMVTELHCIEGWSQVGYWAGARFSSLIDKVSAASRYVSLETRNSAYYFGFDIESA